MAMIWARGAVTVDLVPAGAGAFGDSVVEVRLPVNRVD
jgi:hypothetical protein